MSTRRSSCSLQSGQVQVEHLSRHKGDEAAEAFSALVAEAQKLDKSVPNYIQASVA